MRPTHATWHESFDGRVGKTGTCRKHWLRHPFWSVAWARQTRVWEEAS